MSLRQTDPRGVGMGRWARWRRSQHAVALWPAPQDPLGGLLDDQAHGPALQRWRDWCQAHAGQSVQLRLSCRWSLQWVVEVPAPGGPQQAWALASEQAAHYLGAAFVPSGWAWRAWSVPLPRHLASRPPHWLVVAMPRTLLADLRAVADASGVQLVGLGPWWADWLDAGHSGSDITPDSTVGHAVRLRDADWLLTWDQAQLHCMPMGPAGHALAPAHDADQPWVQGPQGASGLREGPFDWAPRPQRRWRLWRHALRAREALDFMGRVRPMAPWAWAVPVLGGLALVAGLTQSHALDLHTEALLLQQQRLEKAEHRLRVQRAQAPQASQPMHRRAVAGIDGGSAPEQGLFEPWAPSQQAAAQAVMERLSWPWLQGLALSTEGTRAGHARWSHWQFELGDLRRSTTDVPLIMLAAWVTQDDAMTEWMNQAPQARWVSRELLREPLPGAKGVLTLKGQWQKPWPEVAP